MSCHMRVILRPISQDTWWIFNQLKNLTEHFIQTGLINIFTLFTQNFEQPGTQMFVSLRWFCVNRTTVNAQFFSQLKVRPCHPEKCLHHSPEETFCCREAQKHLLSCYVSFQQAYMYIIPCSPLLFACHG